jgi:hypothetical protein
MNTRPARLEDCAKIAEIYNAGIHGRQATFRTWETNAHEIAGWLENPKLPLIVTELEGEVVGWAHASSYRTPTIIRASRSTASTLPPRLMVKVSAQHCSRHSSLPAKTLGFGNSSQGFFQKIRHLGPCAARLVFERSVFTKSTRDSTANGKM